MGNGDQDAHGDVAVGLGVPDADEEAARHLRKVYANRASAARSKERKKAITALEQQVRMLEQQTAAQASEIFGLRAANHALRGQNSAQAQQLLILRQQMRVFEEQLTRALQGPHIDHQQKPSIQEAPASRGQSAAIVTGAGSPSLSMHSSASSAQPHQLSLMRSQHSHEGPSAPEPDCTLAAPTSRSWPTHIATGIGASGGRLHQRGDSMPIITIAAGGHVFVEARGTVGHGLSSGQSCEAMPHEFRPVGLPIPGPMQRTQSLMLTSSSGWPAAEVDPATTLARLTPQQQQQQRMHGIALQSRPSQRRHTMQPESYQTMRINSAPAQLHPRVESIDQWVGFPQAAGSPTHAGFAAFSQQPSAAAQQTDSEPTAAELEAVAIDELNDFMDPASFLDMVDCVPGSNWCTEGSIFQDI